MYESNIKKLIINYTLWNTQFHQVVFTLFLLSKGLTMEQFFLAAALEGVVAMVMEIPTGAFSDRISRKWSLVIGSILHIPITYAMIVSHSYPVILAAFVLSGIAGAFRSGADEALLYDSLKAIHKEDEYKKVNGQMRWYAALSLAAAGIIGGLLAKIDLAYAWWAWLLVAFPLLVVQLSLFEPPLSQEGTEINDSYIIHVGKSFWQAFRGEASYFILYAAIVSLFFNVSYWLWQPYLKLTGLPIVYFGFLYAAINLMSGFVAKNAHKIEPKLGMRTSLLLVPVVFAIGLILQSQIIATWGFVLLLFQEISSGYLSPILETYIQQRIPSSRRATILSIQNMMTTLFFTVFSPIIGHMVGVLSLQTTFALMGVILLIVGLTFALFFKLSSQTESISLSTS